MSPRERNTWIRLASILIVFVPYFMHVVRLFQGEGPISKALCIAFLGAALAHGILDALGQLASRLVFGREMRDERDAAIDALSQRIAYFTLISLILGALSTIAFLGVLTPLPAEGKILQPTYATTSQFVFFCFIAAEALRHGVQLALYRRAAWA